MSQKFQVVFSIARSPRQKAVVETQGGKMVRCGFQVNESLAHDD